MTWLTITTKLHDINYLYNLFESLFIRQYAYVKNEKVSIQIGLSNLCIDAFDGDCSDTIGQKHTCLACLTEHDVKCINRLDEKFCNGSIGMKVDENLLTFEEFLNFGRLEGKEDPNSIHIYTFSSLPRDTGIVFYLMTNILLYYFNLTPEGDFRPTEYAKSIPEYFSKDQELMSKGVDFINEINPRQPSCITDLKEKDYIYI